MQETILVIAAHHDDAIIGAGGTLAKYAQEGKKVHVIIFAQNVMPHLRKEVIEKKSERESKKANQIIGGTTVTFLGENPEEELKLLVKQENPSKIFTHDTDDADPYHRKVSKAVTKLIKEKYIKCAVYSFAIWSFGKIRKRSLRKLIVDIFKTFDTKIESVLAHESKWLAVNLLLWKLLLQAKLFGIHYGKSYAELFYKVH